MMPVRSERITLRETVVHEKRQIRLDRQVSGHIESRIFIDSNRCSHPIQDIVSSLVSMDQ